MISVTADFKTAMKQQTKQLRAYIVDNGMYPDEITGLDDLVSILIDVESSMLKTVMRRGEAVFSGSHSYLETYVNVGIGVVLPDTSVEYIDYGQFLVVEEQADDESQTTKIKFFDKMYEALIAYDLDPIYELTFPCTVGELLEAICTRLGWTLAAGSGTFPNSDYELGTDVITGLGVTYRDVLERIAEIAGSIIYFDVTDELTVKQIAHSSPVEALDADTLDGHKIKANFGPINSVVLARTPQEDNIVDKDQSSIDTYGLTEIKIENNYLVDADREAAIEPILDELLGLDFHPFETTTNGLGYLQVGDRITIEDSGTTERAVVIFGVRIDFQGGIVETLKADIPQKTSTDYNTAGIIGQTIKNTQIIVDRQNGVIILLNSDVSELASQVTELIQTTEDLTIAISGSGGTNLLLNSVGLKGTITEWQTLDENGDPVDSRNDGTIDQSTEVTTNSESGSAITIANQYIEQTLPVIQAKVYTIYLRFKKDGDLNLVINGVTVPVTTDGYTDNTWDTFTYALTTNTTALTCRFETGSGDTATISDMMVKLGEASGWTPAPNEVYGANYKFDKDGLEITSVNSPLKSVVDNEKFAVYDTSAGDRIIMLVSQDSGRITNLTAQETFTVQRYENSEKSLRFIPTTKGAFIVIND